MESRGATATARPRSHAPALPPESRGGVLRSSVRGGRRGTTTLTGDALAHPACIARLLTGPAVGRSAFVRNPSRGARRLGVEPVGRSTFVRGASALTSTGSSLFGRHRSKSTSPRPVDDVPFSLIHGPSSVTSCTTWRTGVQAPGRCIQRWARTTHASLAKKPTAATQGAGERPPSGVPQKPQNCR